MGFCKSSDIRCQQSPFRKRTLLAGYDIMTLNTFLKTGFSEKNIKSLHYSSLFFICISSIYRSQRRSDTCRCQKCCFTDPRGGLSFISAFLPFVIYMSIFKFGCPCKSDCFRHLSILSSSNWNRREYVCVRDAPCYSAFRITACLKLECVFQKSLRWCRVTFMPQACWHPPREKEA